MRRSSYFRFTMFVSAAQHDAAAVRRADLRAFHETYVFVNYAVVYVGFSRVDLWSSGGVLD